MGLSLNCGTLRGPVGPYLNCKTVIGKCDQLHCKTVGELWDCHLTIRLPWSCGIVFEL